jgi:hypothetical protein
MFDNRVFSVAKASLQRTRHGLPPSESHCAHHCYSRVVGQAEIAPTGAALSAVWLRSLIHAEMRLLAHTSPQKICRSQSKCVFSG